MVDKKSDKETEEKTVDAKLDHKSSMKKGSFLERLKIKLLKRKLKKKATMTDEERKKLESEQLKKDLLDINKAVKKKKENLSKSEQRRRRRDTLIRVGVEADPKKIEKLMMQIPVMITTVLTIFFFLKTFASGLAIDKIIFYAVLFWIIVFIVSIMAAWVFMHMFINLLSYKRTKEVEAVLPDYLRLVALNIKAGMPIDRALWYSVRPKFGVLSKEIEVAAKKTLTGVDLKIALTEFADKFDSTVLSRSISLMIEGLDAGGEIGDLLTKISDDIQSNQLMQKEMGAAVITYVIFISFAAIVAAPALMGLSFQLLSIVQGLAAKMGGQTAQSGAFFSISPDTIKLSDFNIFAITSLSATAFFSSIIVTTIQKGDWKEGLKSIPVYILISVTIFLISKRLLGVFLGGIV